MTTNAKFEEFCTSHRDEYGLCFFTVKKPDSDHYVDSGTRDAWIGWQAALSSLEVTPELVSVAKEAWAESSGNGDDDIDALIYVLSQVFDAIKEGKA